MTYAKKNHMTYFLVVFNKGLSISHKLSSSKLSMTINNLIYQGHLVRAGEAVNLFEDLKRHENVRLDRAYKFEPFGFRLLSV